MNTFGENLKFKFKPKKDAVKKLCHKKSLEQYKIYVHAKIEKVWFVIFSVLK